MSATEMIDRPVLVVGTPLDARWGLARAILALARARLGDAAVTDALQQCRPALAAVLRGLCADLDAAERVRAAQVGGLVAATLPSAGIAEIVGDAWVTVFGRLFAARPARLVVEDFAALDPQSARMLLAIARRGTGNLDLVVEAAENAAGTTGPEPHAARVRRSTLRRLALLANVTVHRAPTGAGERTAVPIDPLDDDHDARVIHALRARMPLGEADALAAIREAFDAHGFWHVVEMTEAWLGSSPIASAATLAEVHTLAGIAQLAVDGSDERAAAHLLLAREVGADVDPIRRATGAYYLSLDAARRLRDLAQADRFAREAIELAGGAEVGPRASFVSAWAHNAQAFVLFRRGDLDEARATCERALAALAGLGEDHGDVPATRIAVTRWRIVDNLARLAHVSGDGVARDGWLARRAACEALLEPIDIPYDTWFEARTAEGDLRAEIARYQARAARLALEVEPGPEAVNAHALGSLYYYLGDAPAARAQFEIALERWRGMGEPASQLVGAFLNAAVAAFRAGELSLADQRFGEALALGPTVVDEAGRIEIGAARAVIAAGSQQAAAARTLAEDALAGARTLGDPAVLVRVLRSAAEVELHLDRADLAAAHLVEAQTLAKRDPRAIPAEDLLGVLLALGVARGDLDVARTRARARPRAACARRRQRVVGAAPPRRGPPRPPRRRRSRRRQRTRRDARGEGQAPLRRRAAAHRHRGLGARARRPAGLNLSTSTGPSWSADRSGTCRA